MGSGTDFLLPFTGPCSALKGETVPDSLPATPKAWNQVFDCLPVIIIFNGHGLQLRSEMLGPEVTRQTFFAREVVDPADHRC